MYNEITFDAQQHSSSQIAAALSKNGCVLIRNALNRERILQTSDAVRINAQNLQDMIGKPVNDMPLCFADYHSAHSEPLQGKASNTFTDPLTVSGMDKSWYYEGERNYKPWFWKHGPEFPNTIFQLLRESVLPEVYAASLQDEYICSYAQSVVRYQSPELKKQSYQFHQDGSYHSRDPKDHTGITTWIPLVDCGTDAPALQIYPKALKEVLPKPKGASEPILFCDEELVLEKYGEKLWAPEMRAGDVLVFNAFVVHRTHITPNMTGQRQSADIRVFPKSRMPGFIRDEPHWKVNLAEEF